MYIAEDLFIAKDIFPVFDNTLNDDTKVLLLNMLENPLDSIAEIINWQEILKCLLDHDKLLYEYHYRKVDYLEAQRFLLQYPEEDLMRIDYLTYIFQKQRNDSLFGLYAQLIYFFKDLEDSFKENISVEKFPNSYKEDLKFLLSYLKTFNLTGLKFKIQKHKFGFKSIQILNELLTKYRKNGDSIKFFIILNQLEAYISICKSIKKLKLNFPLIGSSKLIFKELFHPLVKDGISNDLIVEKNVILITGANMSGKSTLLKSVGLAVYLVHLGFPIAATYAEVPFFDVIFIQINHSDDIKNGYSHFMTEIINVKTVIEHIKSNKSCFAVFDELFKGTNHDDALVISEKTIKALQRVESSHFFISTHLSELKDRINNEEVQALFIDCVINEGVPIFSYKLKSGWSDLKIGQILFNKVGLSDLFL